LERYIPLKTSGEVAGIRESCRIAAEVLRLLVSHAVEGVSTRELDLVAAEELRRRGAASGVPAGFPGSICVSVGAVAAHGVPSEYRLRRGDLVSIDVSVLYRGWHGDAAVSLAVGRTGGSKRLLLAAAREALAAAVRAARAGGRVGDIGAAIQAVAARRGCGIVGELEGHGLGRSLHEEPEVPSFGQPGAGPRIVPGMVFTVEPVLCTGAPRLEPCGDGWGLRLADGGAAVHFEHTLAVFRGRTEVLTSGSTNRRRGGPSGVWTR
jgi:methionyl aminopeptidase